ncbi:hypothetical protein E2562_036920 [Oryza meyeriana var. granulata]|uniref:Uncharacterized protein n=1 Tax=Oryza meyeriana var. granulata TaxID=110450 RepID=A0A6G1CLI8_9ORYZ|nr:hypothetical protein E2562_036920 [Oryza meyeriana var. granulata]
MQSPGVIGFGDGTGRGDSREDAERSEPSCGTASLAARPPRLHEGRQEARRSIIGVARVSY